MKNLIEILSRRYPRVLVTGGAGAIGSNLVASLLNGNFKNIIVLDNLSSSLRSNVPVHPRVTFIKGDITDPAVVAKVFKNKIDLIFHLAAHFANQNSVEHPVKDLLANGVGTIHLLEAAVQNKIKKFVYFSTSCIYKSKHQKLKESDLDLQFETPYAISKYVGEKYVHFYHQYYRLPTVTLRIFNSYGPGEKAGRYRNVIPNFFQQALDQQGLVITGTGRETRNFTFVADIIRGVLLAAAKEEAVGEIINLGSQRPVSILELAKLIKKLTNNHQPLIFKPRRQWDYSQFRRGNLELAKKLLGFEARVPLAEGLAAYYAWITQLGKSNENINHH